jgi:transcriptional regulator with XRE-family HTH domain
MSFRTYLKKMLAERDLTQREFAALVGIDGGQMSRLLNEKPVNNPSRETVERMIAVLKCTPDESLDLHCLAGRIPREIELACVSSPLHARFFRMLAQMDEAELKSIVAEHNARRNGQHSINSVAVGAQPHEP